MTGSITARTLIDWGYRPGPWFQFAIGAAEQLRLEGASEAEQRSAVDRFLSLINVDVSAISPGGEP